MRFQLVFENFFCYLKICYLKIRKKKLIFRELIFKLDIKIQEYILIKHSLFGRRKSFGKQIDYTMTMSLFNKMDVIALL